MKYLTLLFLVVCLGCVKQEVTDTVAIKIPSTQVTRLQLPDGHEYWVISLWGRSGLAHTQDCKACKACKGEIEY